MKYEEWLKEWLCHYIEPVAKEKTHRRYAEIAEKHLIPKLGQSDCFRDPEFDADVGGFFGYATGGGSSGKKMTSTETVTGGDHTGILFGSVSNCTVTE